MRVHRSGSPGPPPGSAGAPRAQTLQHPLRGLPVTTQRPPWSPSCVGWGGTPRKRAHPRPPLFTVLGGADLISEPPSPPCGTSCFAEDREGSGVPGDVSAGTGTQRGSATWKAPLLPLLPFPSSAGHRPSFDTVPAVPGSSSFLPEGEVFKKPASEGGQGGGALIMRPTFLRGFV